MIQLGPDWVLITHSLAHHVSVYYQVDLGTGNNNKINWAMGHKQEMIDVIEVSCRSPVVS